MQKALPASRVIQPRYTSIGVALATPTQRFVAFAVDALLGVVLNVVPLLGIVYFLFKDALPYFGGRSIGKSLTGLCVVDAETNESITNMYNTSMLRNVLLLVPVVGLGDAFLIFSGNRRRGGDMLAKTKVIQQA